MQSSVDRLQDAERTEKVSRRVHQLETVSNNVKLLSEMLNNHQPDSSTESDREIMKVRQCSHPVTVHRPPFNLYLFIYYRI